MKTPLLFFALLVMVGSATYAQAYAGANVWLGNTYGPTTDWHHPGNWSKGHVPTETETAVIPDLSNKGRACYPVIRYDVEIATLQLHALAQLTIEKETSLHLLEATEARGFSEAQIRNEGLLVIGLETDTRSRYTRK